MNDITNLIGLCATEEVPEGGGGSGANGIGGSTVGGGGMGSDSPL